MLLLSPSCDVDALTPSWGCPLIRTYSQGARKELAAAKSELEAAALAAGVAAAAALAASHKELSDLLTVEIGDVSDYACAHACMGLGAGCLAHQRGCS